MKLYKPKFWDHKNFISFSLFPLSLIIQLVIFLKKKLSKVSNFKIPIVCIGNIYVGGTGKTPLSVLVAKELSKIGKKPVIIRKYYKEHKDEHSLIKENFSHLILNSNRIDAIQEAQNKNYDTAILDDGFQDYKIKKDLNIICFNSYFEGNGFVIPAGPLRENLSSIKNAQIMIINGYKNLKFEKKILEINNNIDIYYSEYKAINYDKFYLKELLVISGIGNPENFLKLLNNHKLKIAKKYIFPDHYLFSKEEINSFINEARKNSYQIICTEKDYHRIKEFNIKEIDFLKVELVLEKKERLIKKIQSIYD